MGNSFFKRIVDSKTLEELIAGSNAAPVVIFKHSITCPISSAAYRELEQVGGEIALVEVQSAQDLAREIADNTGIRHESPQVIVLRNGKAVWHASHWDVTAETVERATRENA